jgi:hypothetical protein
LHLTGLTYQVTPLVDDLGVSTDIMYDNVVNKFLWGGLDKAKPGKLYLDETVSRMVTTMRSALIDLATALTAEGDLAKNGQLAVPAGMTQEAYVADRYKKALHILDLMMEKLPTNICPFTVQMGEQVARVYYALGKSSDDKSCIEKGTKLLESEMMRYAGYLRFYQSLNPSQYERLTRSDKYIDTQYMLNMLSSYGQQCGEQKYEEFAKKLEAAGVNMGRLQSYQQAYEESMRRQYEAAQQAQQEESSASMEDVLGQ